MQCGKIPEFAEELSSLSPKLTPFIIQGSQATEGEYPWVALVDLGLSGTSGVQFNRHLKFKAWVKA